MQPARFAFFVSSAGLGLSGELDYTKLSLLSEEVRCPLFASNLYCCFSIWCDVVVQDKKAADIALANNMTESLGKRDRGLQLGTWVPRHHCLWPCFWACARMFSCRYNLKQLFAATGGKKVCHPPSSFACRPGSMRPSRSPAIAFPWPWFPPSVWLALQPSVLKDAVSLPDYKDFQFFDMKRLQVRLCSIRAKRRSALTIVLIRLLLSRFDLSCCWAAFCCCL
jgi:hypothetical protein